MRFSARIVGLLFAFLLLFFAARTSFAQTTPVLQNNIPQQQKLQVNTDSNVPLTTHNWVQTVMLEVMSAMTCQLAGVDPLAPKGKCLGYNPATQKIGYIESSGGVAGTLGGMIAYLYIPPLHTGDYVSYLSQNFGIAKSTYAQGTGVGFAQLNPLINLWTKMRNIVYFLFVVIFVAVGISIMLRVKILNAQAVMTIQNQIPKLIIGLILITFSYAIAGFLVDIMWVSTYGIANVITSETTPDVSAPAPVFVNNFTPGGLGGVAFNAAGGTVQVIQNMFGSLTQPIDEQNNMPKKDCGGAFNPANPAGWVLCSFLNGDNLPDITNPGEIIAFAGGSFFQFMGGIVSSVISIIAGMLAFLIIIIAIIVSLFRLWFQLLKSFIFVLIDVIFAPFWILAGLVPGTGQSVGFGAWVRDMLGNLAVFPAVVALFSIAKVFATTYPTSPTNAFIPPLIGNTGATSVLQAFVVLGIILASPSVVDAVRKAFKAPGLGVGIGGISTGQAIVAGAIGGGIGRTFRTHINPNTGERVALGPGARFIERRVNRPIARTILGFGARESTPAKIVENAGTPTVVEKEDTPTRPRRKNLNRQSGGGSSSGGSPTGGTTPPPTQRGSQGSSPTGEGSSTPPPAPPTQEKSS